MRFSNLQEEEYDDDIEGGGASRAYHVTRFTTLTKHFALRNVLFWLTKSIFSATRHFNKLGNGKLTYILKIDVIVYLFRLFDAQQVTCTYT